MENTEPAKKKIELSIERKANLEKPMIQQNGPYTIKNLEDGKTYKYCTCGLSKKDPFCDGSHKGTKFKPILFKPKPGQSRHLICGCRRNSARATVFCDGSHSLTCADPEQFF